jgi:hypothetical protein
MSNGNPGNQPIAIKQAFWIGALGGISPLAARGAGHLVANGNLPPIVMGSLIAYAFALLLFFGLGGVISVFTDDPAARTFKSAFALGLSIPSLFQLGALQAGGPKTTADISRPLHVALISSAFAQEPTTNQAKPTGMPAVPDDARSAERKLEVSTPRSPISNNVSATFLDKSGNILDSKTIQPGFAAVNVPANAASVQFQKDGAASEARPLSDHPVQSAKVGIEQKALGAFTQAIGLSREVKPSIELERVSDAKKVPEKTYGWCYLGTRGPDGWRIRSVDFAGQGVPEKGTVVKTNVPLTISKTVEDNDVLGVALTGQQLRIEEIKNRGDDYWAAVTVVE